MAKVYVEPRPKGRQEGDPIDDYVVEDHADHVLATHKTQHEAIQWARSPWPQSFRRPCTTPERQKNPGPLAFGLKAGSARQLERVAQVA